MKNPALAIGDGHEQRLVLAGAAGGFVRESRSQHGDVLGRPAQLVVEFILGVHPFRRQTRHNRVVRGASHHQEGVLSAVVAARTGPGVGDKFAITLAKQGARILITSFPSAQGDHLVVLLPFWERVVRRMHRNESTAAPDEADQRFLHRLGPRLSVVIRHDGLIGGEVGFETGHVLASGRGSGHLDLDHARLLENVTQHRCGRFPIVVVLPIDNQHFERSGSTRVGAKAECHSQRPKLQNHVHGRRDSMEARPKASQNFTTDS